LQPEERLSENTDRFSRRLTTLVGSYYSMLFAREFKADGLRAEFEERANIGARMEKVILEGL
jgi:hypothetical protein